MQFPCYRTYSKIFTFSCNFDRWTKLALLGSKSCRTNTKPPIMSEIVLTKRFGWSPQDNVPMKQSRKQSREKGRIQKVCRSNEQFNAWLDKSTVTEDLPGPQDRGRNIQQNNGLLYPAPLPLPSSFSATSAPSASTCTALELKIQVNSALCQFATLDFFGSARKKTLLWRDCATLHRLNHTRRPPPPARVPSLALPTSQYSFLFLPPLLSHLSHLLFIDSLD